MQYRNQIVALAAVSMLCLPACNLIKKVAKGEKIDRNDLVNEADKQVKQNQANKEKIAKYEESINEDLKTIEEQRKEGRFSSADYREKRFSKNLAELQKLDSKNALLTEAPKRLEVIKSEWTEDVYNRKVLTAECAKDVEEAKAARMEENWYRVERSLTDYSKCRRKLKDVGIEESVITGQDELAIAEYKEFIDGYVMTKITDLRKEKNFRTSIGFETSLEDQHLRYYSEMQPDSAYPKTVLTKLKTIRKKYRDPEEVKAEKAQKAFDAWRDQVTKSFESDWSKISSAEEAARPDFDAGVKAFEDGDAAAAETKLLAARQKLYSAAYPSAIALEAAYKNGSLEKGLSYEISAALARIYFESGDKSKLYPELSIIKEGRTWMSKEEELQVRLFDILADRTGKLSPKPTDPVKRYAGRYSDLGKEYKGVAELAEARQGEAYNTLGVEIETLTHRQAGSNTADKVGQVVYMEEAVTNAQGSKLRFDFKSEYQVPTKCWNTKEVSSVNVYTGAVYYKQKCKYKKVKDGYSIVVNQPKGIKVKKGDIVSFYAVIKERKGKFDVILDKPGYVRVAPSGQTKWFLGAKVD